MKRPYNREVARPRNTANVTFDDDVIAWLGMVADRNGSTIMGVAGALIRQLMIETDFIEGLEADQIFPRRKRRGRPRRDRPPFQSPAQLLADNTRDHTGRWQPASQR